MFTIEKIKKNFKLSKIISFKENTGSYTETFTEEFADFGGFCDVYIQEFENEILQNQIDAFNHFLDNFKNYLSQINAFVFSNLKSFEINTDNQLVFDVVFIPQNNSKYDLVLVCGKKINFLLFNKQITLRIEFKDNIIKSIKRTNNSTEDNT
jgi:hypothetical protein